MCDAVADSADSAGMCHCIRLCPGLVSFVGIAGWRPADRAAGIAARPVCAGASFAIPLAVETAREGVEVGIGGALLAEVGMQGVAGGVLGMIFLLEGLFRGGAAIRAGAQRASIGASGLGLLILVGAVFGDGVDAARRDIETACTVRTDGKQAGDRLDAGADGVVGFEGKGRQSLAGEGGGESRDMLRLVGSTVPPADLIPAREFENGGQHDIFEAGAALVELVELPGAPVAIQAEDEGGGGVGEAPIYATDDLRPDGIRARIAQMSLRGGVEAVDEALEGDKQTFDLLQREGATVAKLRDVVGREVPGVDVGSGAKERMTGAGPLLEVQPEAVAATGRAGCPSGGADAALPEASFEDLPGVIAGEGRFVEPEPGEIEAAHGIGSIQGAKEDLGAAGVRQMAGGLVIGGDEAGRQAL